MAHQQLIFLANKIDACCQETSQGHGQSQHIPVIWGAYANSAQITYKFRYLLLQTLIKFYILFIWFMLVWLFLFNFKKNHCGLQYSVLYWFCTKFFQHTRKYSNLVRSQVHKPDLRCNASYSGRHLLKRNLLRRMSMVTSTCAMFSLSPLSYGH